MKTVSEEIVPVGTTVTYTFVVTNTGDVTLFDITVDDEAGVSFPDSAQITSGAYRPEQYALRTFPAPAPVASGSTELSVFDGLDPDGEWRLFALDDAPANFSSLDGWSLEFSWEDTASPIGTVSINGGAASTASRDVTVNLTYTAA